MPYDRLRRRLAERTEQSVVALPDGSVDTYYRLQYARGEPIETSGAFADWVAAPETRGCRVDRSARTMGGQAVNTARQCDALGDDVTLFGHLDHPIFDDLSVPAHSMGAPADVTVLVFEDDEILLTEESSDLRTWTPPDLFACPGAASTLDAADAVAIQNWVGVPGMDDALRDLASRDLSAAVVVFDPGDITSSDASALGELGTALRALGAAHEVVLSVNEDEMQRFISVLDADGATFADRMAAVRGTLDLDAVVVHDVERALAVTDAGTHRVRNLRARRVRRRTGGGDRFNAGLAHGVAADWDWEVALALGNACASYYVEGGETASVADALAYVEDRCDGEERPE